MKTELYKYGTNNFILYEQIRYNFVAQETIVVRQYIVTIFNSTHKLLNIST